MSAIVETSQSQVFPSAPLGRSIKRHTWTVIVGDLVLLLLAVGCWAGLKTEPWRHICAWMLGFAFVIALAYTLFDAAGMVLGYELRGKLLIIKRPGWSTRVKLKGLIAVKSSPFLLEKLVDYNADPVRRADPSMFSIAGLIGEYNCYATDAERAVVLQYRGRAAVVTPLAEVLFIAEIKKLLNSGALSDPSDKCPNCGQEAGFPMGAQDRGRLCRKGHWVRAFTSRKYCVSCDHAWW